MITSSGFKYVERTDFVPELDDESAATPKPKRARPRKPRRKHDKKYIAAARELRDRYLEEVNAPGTPGGLALLPPAAQGKYDVSRTLDAAPRVLKEAALLDAA